MTTDFSPESVISVGAEDSSSSGPYEQEGKKLKHDGAFNASAVVEKLLTQEVFPTQSTRDTVAPVVFHLEQGEAPQSDDDLMTAEADAEASHLNASLLLFEAEREEERARENERVYVAKNGDRPLRSHRDGPKLSISP